MTSKKTKICFYVSEDVLNIIRKRAKKNMLELDEQVEDIVRRSCVNCKKMKKIDQKVDDALVSVFSRQRRAKKK